jgi:hypothetical protein
VHCRLVALPPPRPLGWLPPPAHVLSHPVVCVGDSA